MKSSSRVTIGVMVAVSTLMSLNLPTEAASISSGFLDSSAGQRCKSEGSTFQKSASVTLECRREGGRLVWRRARSSLNSKITWNDLQIVFSRGGYTGQSLMYSRSDASFREFQSAVLVAGAAGYEIRALDYHRWSKTLLFSIYNTNSRLHSVFRVGLGVAGARPTLVASGLFVIDGKIDIRSGDPILLVMGSGFAGYRLTQYSSIGPVEIWNALNAGWLSSRGPLVFPQQIIPGTGGENWVTGSSLNGQGWRIDRISNRDGRLFVSTYMVGSGELGGAAKDDIGFADIYWALATSTGYFICRDPLLSTVFVPSAQNCRTMPTLGATSGSASRKMTFVIDPSRKGAISLWDVDSGQLINPESGELRALGLPGCFGCRVQVVNVQEIDLNLLPSLTTWRILSDTAVG